MDLAQLREFTNAYYGTGTAFQTGTWLITNPEATLRVLLDIAAKKNVDILDKEPLPQLLQLLKLDKSSLAELKEEMEDSLKQIVEKVVDSYDDTETGLTSIARVLIDNMKDYTDPLTLLQDMYSYYAPFRYSIENKEMALTIRSTHIVEEYTRDATDIQKQVLESTEREAELTKKWVLKIQDKSVLTHGSHGKIYTTSEVLVLISSFLIMIAEFIAQNSKSIFERV
jgi:hypothetical protein